MSEELMENGELRVENGGSEWREARLESVLEVKYGKDHKKQLRTLQSLRDTLLPKLMSGEVRVQYDKEVAQ